MRSIGLHVSPLLETLFETSPPRVADATTSRALVSGHISTHMVYPPYSDAKSLSAVAETRDGYRPCTDRCPPPGSTNIGLWLNPDPVCEASSSVCSAMFFAGGLPPEPAHFRRNNRTRSSTNTGATVRSLTGRTVAGQAVSVDSVPVETLSPTAITLPASGMA